MPRRGDARYQGVVRTGATFADVAQEFLRYVEHGRARKITTVKTYASITRTHRLPAFGGMRLEDFTRDAVEAWVAATDLPRPAGQAGRCDLPHSCIHRPVPRRAAGIALARPRLPRATVRMRCSYAGGQLTTPKSGKMRSLPLVPDVASAPARLGERELLIADNDLVFVVAAGSHLDAAALRRRYQAALRRASIERHARATSLTCKHAGHQSERVGTCVQ